MFGAATFGQGMSEAKTQPGFHMPEEAGPHERTFMQWPVNRKVYSDPVFLNMQQQAIADVANTISEFEPVIMLMDRRYTRAARRKLGNRVEIWHIPTDDLWCRDAGPVFVKNARNELAIAHIQFNGWGDKQVHANDGRIAKRIAKRLGLPLIDTGLVGEAGGVETDGNGTLMAHESCWVNPNRNRESRDIIEKRLLKALGAQKMIWAPGIRGGDITDYHIDVLARFVKPGVVVIQLPAERDQHDPWSRAAFKTYDILRSARDARGRPIKVLRLPEPHQTLVKSEDFVASYVNYYICNGAVIMPHFGDRQTDTRAVSVLQNLYQNREVVTLNIDTLGETGGGIHCATQQQPKV